MLRTMLKSKIHNATVTRTELSYVGSITIDRTLIERTDILVNEQVQVVNLNNGERFETYVIPGEPGSGEICLNGPAARLAEPGDIVHILSYALYTPDERTVATPHIIVLGEKNRIIDEH